MHMCYNVPSPSLCLRRGDACDPFLQTPSHSWETHPLRVYTSQPSNYFTNCLLAFAQWAGRAPRKSFILSQVCLPKQMFYIMNTKSSCPEVLASKNWQVALAFGRWRNEPWRYVLQSPHPPSPCAKGGRQYGLMGAWTEESGRPSFLMTNGYNVQASLGECLLFQASPGVASPAPRLTI